VYFVKFFGTDDHAWIKVDQLKSYHLHKDKMMKANKSKRFQHSLDAVEEFIRKKKASGKELKCQRKVLTLQEKVKVLDICFGKEKGWLLLHKHYQTSRSPAPQTQSLPIRPDQTSRSPAPQTQSLPNRTDQTSRSPAPQTQSLPNRPDQTSRSQAPQTRSLPNRSDQTSQFFGGRRPFITDFHLIIISRGGRYLEAPVSGNKHLSEEGLLILLAAGDRTLYDDCISCFQAVSKRSFYLGKSLIMVTFQTSCTCPCLLGILQGDYEPSSSLKHVQKDLRLAIAMGDSLHQQTPMAAAANEVNRPYQTSTNVLISAFLIV
uniref:Cytokine-like nuclear factor N-PAC n=1 Tax=Eptatretus burgeri TaxID=7764 RepID=A0A8C4Q2P4_EPTBU